MSQLAVHERYVYDAQYQRWQFQQYNYETRCWQHQQWMPIGWQCAPGQGQEEYARGQQEQQPSGTGHQGQDLIAPPTPYSNPESTARRDSAYTIRQLSAHATPSQGNSAAAGPLYPNNYQPTGQAQHPNSGAYGHQNTSHHPQYYPTGSSSTNGYGTHLTPQPQFNPPSKGKGLHIYGDYGTTSPVQYELIDPSFYVRPKGFFHEGKVFSVIMNETAGATATTSHRATDYTSRSISSVKYQDNYVHTNVRRFVVVRQKREFCFACPVFTYSGRATTKPGVAASEHGIAYSWGSQPTLLPGEYGITKPSLTVVMIEGEKILDKASRIYYGIHHPIQYNVKVKDIGYVVPDQVHLLISNWKAEDGETKQSGKVTANAEVPQGDFQGRPDTESNDDGEDDGEDDGGGNDIDNQDGGDDGDVQGGAEGIEQLARTFADTSIQAPVIAHSSYYASSQSAQPETSKGRSTKDGKRRKK